MQQSEKLISAGDILLDVLSAGAGPDLVLLHGMGSTARSFNPITEKLAERYRVTAWNAPGYGRSANISKEKPTADDYARVLGSLFEQVGIERCVLAGHSLGALVGAAFAVAFPEKVRGIVLADPGRGFGLGPDDPWPEPVAKRNADLADLGPAGYAARRAPLLCAPDASEESIAAVEREMARISPEGLARASWLLSQAWIDDALHALTCPVLVMGGEFDRVTPIDDVRLLSEIAPGAKFVTLTGVGHAGYVEDPEQYRGAIESFIGSL
mgnify:CR=1 FL=1